MTPAPYVELALAYRSDDSSPTVANLVILVDELALDGSTVIPEDGELI